MLPSNVLFQEWEKVTEVPVTNSTCLPPAEDQISKMENTILFILFVFVYLLGYCNI